MIFKRKNYDYELEFEAGIDLQFWALPASICVVVCPSIRCLKEATHILLRFLCFQFSWEIWKWGHEITDVDNSIEDILNG